MEEYSEQAASPAPAETDLDQSAQATDLADIVSTCEEASPNEAADAAATVEAALFASDSPLTAAKISMAAELPAREVKQAIKQLNARYEEMGSAFAIEEIAGGYQMLTRPQYNDVLQRLLRARSDSKLSQAAMEALAIVAYRQPIIRADIEAIRGVASGEVLRGLLEKNLAKIVGRAEVLGRPMLYGTTRRFLEVFGLASLDDLPRVEELRSGAQHEEAAVPSATPQQQTSPEEDTEPAATVGDQQLDSRREPMGQDDVSDDKNFSPEEEELDFDNDFEAEDDFDDEDFDDEDFDDDDFDDDDFDDEEDADEEDEED